MPDRCVYKSDNYKVYGCFVNASQYPNVKINKYGTATIVGDVQDLALGIEYEVVATEELDKRGYNYKVVNIRRPKPNSVESSRKFLYEIITPNQADTLLSVYPDIVNKIMKNKLDDVDLSKTSGIKEYTFNLIKQKVIENFKLADLVNEFDGLFTISMLKKMYTKYPSIEKLRSKIREKPYDCLCELSGVGFKTADSMLLEIDKTSKKKIEKGEKPILFFNFDLKTSYQRMKACVYYLLSENEGSGNTYLNVVDVRKQALSMAKDAALHLPAILKGDEGLYFDKENLRLALKTTYETEKYIADKLKEGLSIKNVWDIDVEKYRIVDGNALTDEQMGTAQMVCQHNIGVLRGNGGCVDSETEFFNGYEWKKISDYQNKDMVLQYERSGKTSLVQPSRYIKEPCEYMWHFSTKYGLDQCLSDEHNCYYITSKGNLYNKTFKEIRENHEKTGFLGKFITSFKYDGAGLCLSDDYIRLAIAIFADGSFYGFAKEHQNSYHTCRFHLKKSRKKNRLEYLLNKLNIKYNISKSAAVGYHDYYFTAPFREKHFSKEWYECSTHQKEIIMDEIMFWDGFNSKNNCYATSSKSDADFVQFVYSSSGYRATIYEGDRTGKEHITCGKTYIRKSKEYTVSYTKRVFVGLNTDKRCGRSVTEIAPFKTKDGFKYCFTVDSGMLVLRRNNKVFITGNSGKSFSSQSVINMLKDNNKSFILLAPTGRAAKVLASYTKNPASTIHRGLGYNPKEGWLHNKDNPLTVDAVVLDEFSMTDIFLFKRLLEAIDFNKTKLLVIGDDAQLASVGAGNILYDILNSNAVPVTTLTKIFRYGIGGLSTVATNVRNSEQYLDKTQSGVQIFGEDKAYTFIPSLQEKSVANLVALYKKLLSQGNAIEDILVLSSYNKGEYGTDTINKKIQQAVNGDEKHLVKFGETEFRLNDPVIQTVNNYKAVLYNGYYDPSPENETFIANGETGKIVEVLSNAIIVDFDGTKIYCDKAALASLRLAYSISLHKSQGGQCKNIIVLSPKAHTYMLNSNLLYVGITRAKERCFHIGEITVVNRALKKKENFDRNTFLCDLLKEEKVG